MPAATYSITSRIIMTENDIFLNNKQAINRTIHTNKQSHRDTVASPGFVVKRGKDGNYVIGHSW